jgi:nitrogen fixation NifU-like protein
MDDFMEAIYRRIAKGVQSRSDAANPGHSLQPNKMNRMPAASCSGVITGSCGETMEIYLHVECERITGASYYTNGCEFSRLCGTIATWLAFGQSLDEAAVISGDTILMAVGELPASETHCAYLAAEALHAAIHDWMLKY